MQGKEKADIIFMELRQRLQSGLLIIRSDPVAAPDEVNVSSGDSTLKIRVCGDEYRVKLPPGVSLVEGFCQKSPHLNNDGLHIRLRLKVDQIAEASDSVLRHLKAQEKYCVLCQSCGATVLKDRVFKRVLPLPNGNWNTLVDDWCCHPDPFANKKLLPKAEDCFLGDTYFLFTRDSSSDQTLTEAADSSRVTSTPLQYSGAQTPARRNVTVCCKKCSAVLGEAVTTEVLKFYITEVVVKHSEDEDEDDTIPQNRLQFLEGVLTSRLIELSSAQSTFRFSIQSPSGKSVVMLWLLNTDTLISSCSEKAISSLTSDRPLDEHQSRQAVSAVKVLYLPCTRSTHQETVDAWEKDISVHPLVLPQHTCEDLLQLLGSCTSSLPSSLHCMNSYQVAYLRR